MGSQTAERGPIRSLVAACRKFYESSRWDPLQTRRSRRQIAIAYVVSLAAVPLVAWLTESVLAVWAAYAMWVAALFILGVATRGLTEKPMRFLDERERQWRQGVFREPYWVGVLAGVVAAGLLTLSLGAPEAMANAILFVIFGVLWGIPNVTLAWRMPESTDDEA